MARQRAKAPNFGFPGGMGAMRFVANAEKDAIEDFFNAGKWSSEIPTLQEAEQLKRQWHDTWPEMRPYFKWVSDQLGGSGDDLGVFRAPGTGRYRGQVGFCDGANYQFQSLTADGAKDALYATVKACYDPNSSLYGQEVINFIHDEIMMQVDEQNASAIADEQMWIQINEMSKYTPNVPVAASPTLARYWIDKDKGLDSKKDKETGLWSIEG